MEGAKLPSYATEGSAGMDLYANIDEPIVLDTLDRVCIPTGIKLSIPSGLKVNVQSKSGKALKEGKVVILGLVDYDYRGQIGVILINLSKEKVTINRHDAVGQMVFTTYEKVELELTDVLDETARGEGGFGSTNR